jgi:hypothetical protein
MSSSDHPPPPPPPKPVPPPSGSGGSGCLNAFLVLVGIVLLLPGLCAIILAALDWREALSSSFLPVLVICLVVAFGGIMLIRLAMRGPRS